MIRSFIAVFLLSVLAQDVVSAGGRESIHESAVDAQPLMPSMMAPPFEVRTATDEPFSYDPGAMEKPVVLTFFRGGWCPYCNLHLAEMRKAEASLKHMGFDVWFISIDKPGVLRKSLDEPDIGYTLFSDSKLEATRAFGLAFRVDDATVERYLGHGIDLEAASGETHHVLPVPATYIIAKDGIINFAYANPKYTTRLHPEVLLAAARALQADTDSRLRRMRKAQRANN